MVAKDDTSKSRPSRNQTDQATAAPGSPGSTKPPHSPPPSTRSALEQAIEAERTQLLEVHSVLRCLYEALLHGDGEDAIAYAEAAYVAARLIDESVERLDLVRLKPMIEAETKAESGRYGKYEVRECPPPYLS